MAATTNRHEDVFSLGKLNPETLRDSCLVCLVAQKGCGKTTLLKNLLYTKRHLPGGACFTASGESNSEYEGIFPKMFMYNTCDLAQIEEIYRYQTTKNNKYKRKLSKEKKHDMVLRGQKVSDLPKEERYTKDPTVIMVLEDMLSDKKLFNKKIVRDLAMNGRHQNIFALLTCQYIKDLPPSIRSNIDYWFIFKEDNDKVRHELYDMFAKVHLKTYSMFTEVMDQATADHRVLFIDARESSPDPHKKFKWFRADHLLPDFRVGCDRYWRFAKKNYKPPDATNKVIVNKYTARMAANQGMLTDSEMFELQDRDAVAQESTHSKKRKRAPEKAASNKKQKPLVVLEEESQHNETSSSIANPLDGLREFAQSLRENGAI